MRRREAVALLVAALLMVAGGATWLFGPFGLAGSGLVLGVVTLIVFDVKE